MTSEEYEKSSRLWYLIPIFLGIIGGLIAYLILKKDNSKLARRCLIVGILITIIPAIIGFSLVLYGTALGGTYDDDFVVSRPQIENNYVGLFVDPSHKVDIVWGAVTVTNTGQSSTSVDNISVRGKNIPFVNWYVDKDQTRVTSNFSELKANKINSSGQMLDSSGLTGECGGANETILRMNLDESGSKPTLCLEQNSGSVSLDPGDSTIIYFKSSDELLTSLVVGLVSNIGVGAGMAYEIDSVTVRSIPSS